MKILTEDQQKDLNSITDNLYQMYDTKPSYIKDEEALPMYSYTNPAVYFWRGFISGLLKKGASKEEVIWIVQSKLMRWMFDGQSEEVEDFGESMVTDSYIENARINMIKEQ